jgi:hypothetical protein
MRSSVTKKPVDLYPISSDGEKASIFIYMHLRKEKLYETTAGVQTSLLSISRGQTKTWHEWQEEREDIVFNGLMSLATPW